MTESGGDINEYSVNASNIDQQKKKVAKKISKNVKATWKRPKYPILGWDEKRMERNGKMSIR